MLIVIQVIACRVKIEYYPDAAQAGEVYLLEAWKRAYTMKISAAFGPCIDAGRLPVSNIDSTHSPLVEHTSRAA